MKNYTQRTFIKNGLLASGSLFFISDCDKIRILDVSLEEKIEII